MLKKLGSEVLLNETEEFTTLVDYFENDEEDFQLLANTFPLIVYCNEVNTWKVTFVNQTMQRLLDKTETEILSGGFDYIKAISDPEVFDGLFEKVKHHTAQMEVGDAFIYNQRIRFQQDYEWMITYKKKINDETYLNLAQTSGMLGHIGEMMEKMMQPASVKKNWVNIDKLTESEKKILERLYEGQSSESIAKEQFISVNTVNTHRKNVLKKLDASSTIEAIRIYEAFSFLM